MCLHHHTDNIVCYSTLHPTTYPDQGLCLFHIQGRFTLWIGCQPIMGHKAGVYPGMMSFDGRCRLAYLQIFEQWRGETKVLRENLQDMATSRQIHRPKMVFEAPTQEVGGNCTPGVTLQPELNRIEQWYFINPHGNSQTHNIQFIQKNNTIDFIFVPLPKDMFALYIRHQFCFHECSQCVRYDRFYKQCDKRLQQIHTFWHCSFVTTAELRGFIILGVALYDINQQLCPIINSLTMRLWSDTAQPMESLPDCKRYPLNTERCRGYDRHSGKSFWRTI